jgi:hypothetical protein
MSWHSSGILIQADSLPGDPFLLGLLGFPGAKEIGPIDFDTATSLEVLNALEGDLGAAVARVEGWTSIWGPLLAADSDALSRLSAGGAVLTLMLEGASGTAGFEWFRDSTLLRRWFVQEGIIIADEGEPLPEEAEAATKGDEYRVLSLLQQLVLPLSVLDDAQYTLYRFSA